MSSERQLDESESAAFLVGLSVSYEYICAASSIKLHVFVS